MIKPKTASELMLFNTVRLVASNDSTGTGFFFNFSFEDNIGEPVIITNQHVVNYNKSEKVSFFLHTKNGDAPGEKIKITLETKWFFHPTQDLCFCLATPIIRALVNGYQKEIFYVATYEEFAWSSDKLEELSAIEEVVMVGYPNGLWDEKNNLPLFRKGITASHPAIDFNNEGIGAVDMACFPGSSGSPIFILNEDGYINKKNGKFKRSKRLVFLGVLSEGPQLNAKGELITENIPTQRKISALTPMMINLGYYIKAAEILTFKKMIKEIIENEPTDKN